MTEHGLAPDVMAAGQLANMIDKAASRLLSAEIARDAFEDDPTSDDAIDLVEEAGYADGWLCALAEALGMLLDRDPLGIVAAAKERACHAREAALAEMEALVLA